MELNRTMSVANPDTAAWLKTSMEKFWGRNDNANYVAAIIPAGFESYARILHPGSIKPEGREVSWAEIAARFGYTPHAQMQWHAITESIHPAEAARLNPPSAGNLPRKHAQELVEILGDHTGTPQDCYFAIWDGWGLPVLDALTSKTANLRLPHRSYHLSQDPIGFALQSISPLTWQSANMWWPEDRAWCVAIEVDLMWTYVGGRSACINAILADNRLEAWPATPDDRVDVNSDQINP